MYVSCMCVNWVLGMCMFLDCKCFSFVCVYIKFVCLICVSKC